MDSYLFWLSQIKGAFWRQGGKGKCLATNNDTVRHHSFWRVNLFILKLDTRWVENVSGNIVLFYMPKHPSFNIKSIFLNVLFSVIWTGVLESVSNLISICNFCNNFCCPYIFYAWMWVQWSSPQPQKHSTKCTSSKGTRGYYCFQTPSFAYF